MAETNENAAALPSGPVAKVLRGIVNVICKINKFSGELMSYTLLLLLGLMIFEVLSRYVFKSPTVWGYESLALWHACVVGWRLVSTGKGACQHGHALQQIYAALESGRRLHYKHRFFCLRWRYDGSVL